MTADFDEARATREAIAALAHRIRNMGDADPEPFAQEFIAALKGQGWRPTAARRPGAGWRPRTGPGAPPSEAYLQAKRHVLAIASDQVVQGEVAGEQPATEAPGDGGGR